MSCTDKWAHEALDRLFVGELEGPEFGRLQGHVKDCPSCLEQYERVTRAQAKLEGAEVLPRERLSLLEHGLMAKVAAGEKKAQPAKAPRLRFWMPAVSFALAAGLVAFVVFTPSRSEFQARGPAAETAFGVRAFCVDTAGKVSGEALPGGKLNCPPGATVQLTYTAPRAAKLSIAVKEKGGAAEPLFPSGGGAQDVSSGVDLPLGFSTPVTSAWLSQPVDVVATFTDESGKTYAESAIRLAP